MKFIIKISLIWGLFFLCVNFADAEDVYLTPFSSQSEADNFFKDTALKINGASYILSKNDLLKWVSEQSSLTYNQRYKSEIENPNFCQYKKSIACALSFSVKNEGHIMKNYQWVLDSSLVVKFSDDLARQINRDPVDAKLAMENGKVSAFTLSQNGIQLDKERSVELLIDYFKNKKTAGSLELPYRESKPEIDIASIDNLGITSLVGEGRSNFAGSPKNRIFNIKVATDRFNGVLIKPGEEFSFVKVLGEVDGEHGYLPELVIKQDKTEPEFGGGICQVSTTTFRAAINSGLPITARKNHAYPVSYYNPQGMDATVYVPRPDLRFINDTPNYILIETEISGTELIFRFYGTNDGRRTNIIGPKILERNSDGSMKATFTQQVFDKNGNLMREDVFNSSYDSPAKFPHPGAILSSKPADWTKKQWSDYKKANHL